jgi:Ca2+-binding RTX toxin-like protein
MAEASTLPPRRPKSQPIQLANLVPGWTLTESTIADFLANEGIIGIASGGLAKSDTETAVEYDVDPGDPDTRDPLNKLLDSLLFSKGALPIFAVTGGVTSTYTAFVTEFGRGSTVPIDSSSTNISDSVRLALAELFGEVTARGDDGANIMIGTPDRDTMFGLGGADRIEGREGDDTIDGGTGDDLLYGQEGDDTITGGGGNDFLHGDLGLSGPSGDGNDTLIGNGSSNYENLLDGGAGDDLFIVTQGEGDAGDRIIGGEGNDMLRLVLNQTALSDQAIVAAWLAEQSVYVTNFLDSISQDGRDYDAEDRARMWANKSLNTMYERGRLEADRNGLYEWRLGNTEEHCDDCLRLNEQRHRLKDWHRRGLVPQSSSLACKGYNCDCSLVRVSGRARGRF